uniref:Uncharacterized protein n=1 Tax=Aureoumbra lagunensis TaxID=44058 RepID=A0A7S3JWA5_9STRA
MASCWSVEERGILERPGDETLPPEIDACVGLYDHIDSFPSNKSAFCGRSTFGMVRKEQKVRDSPGVGRYDLPRELGSVPPLRKDSNMTEITWPSVTWEAQNVPKLVKTQKLAQAKRFEEEGKDKIYQGDPGRYKKQVLEIGKSCPVTRPESTLTIGHTFAKSARLKSIPEDNRDFALGSDCHGTLAKQMVEAMRRCKFQLSNQEQISKKVVQKEENVVETISPNNDAHRGLRTLLLLREKQLRKKKKTCIYQQEPSPSKGYDSKKFVLSTEPRPNLLDAMARAGRAYCYESPGPCAYSDQAHSLATLTSRTYNIRLDKNAHQQLRKLRLNHIEKTKKAQKKKEDVALKDIARPYSHSNDNVKSQNYRRYLFIMKPPIFP